MLRLPSTYFRISGQGSEPPRVEMCSAVALFSELLQELAPSDPQLRRSSAVSSRPLSVEVNVGSGDVSWSFEAFSVLPQCFEEGRVITQWRGGEVEVHRYQLQLSSLALLRRYQRSRDGGTSVHSLVVLPPPLAEAFAQAIACAGCGCSGANDAAMRAFSSRLLDLLLAPSGASDAVLMVH